MEDDIISPEDYDAALKDPHSVVGLEPCEIMDIFNWAWRSVGLCADDGEGVAVYRSLGLDCAWGRHIEDRVPYILKAVIPNG